jgi:hypothetical protein
MSSIRITEQMRYYMKRLKGADDSQAGLVQFDPQAILASHMCEDKGWARWDGKKAMGERIMFLTTKGLRAMQYHGWSR